MCILNILYQFFPDFWTSNNGRNRNTKSKIFLVNFWEVRVWYFLIDEWVVNLNLLKWRENFEFFFDFLNRVKDKSLHIHVPKIMRDTLIKEPAVLINKFFLFEGFFGFIIDNRKQLIKRVIALCDSFLS